MDVNEHAAIVTGAASGLGYATALALCDHGAKVAFIDVNENIEEKAQASGGTGYQCNIRDASATEKVIAAACAEHGPARVLVNCAGIGQMEPVVDSEAPMPLEHFTEVLRVNLVGTFKTVRLAAADMMKLPSLEDGSRGVIINVASGAGHEGGVGQIAYVASKGGVISMTLALAREFGDYGIRVVTVSPGGMRTPILEVLPEEVINELTHLAPFPKRLGEPAEFAKLVLHICENTFLNGAVIRFDAGTRIPYGGAFQTVVG